MADTPAPTTQTNDPRFQAWLAEASNAPNAPAALHGMALSRWLQLYNWLSDQYGAKQTSTGGVGLIPPTNSPTVTLGLRNIGVATNAPALKPGSDPYTGHPVELDSKGHPVAAGNVNTGGTDSAAVAATKSQKTSTSSDEIQRLTALRAQQLRSGDYAGATQTGVKLTQLQTGTGTGTTLPWMSSYTTSATGGIISTKGLTGDQVKLWMKQYEHDTGISFKDTAAFLADPGVQMGRGPARAALETALNIGNSEDSTYSSHGMDAKGNTAQLAMATDPLNHGYKAADPYMRMIVTAAAQFHVPWQLIYGVIRSASGFSTAAAGGLTGLKMPSSGPPITLHRSGFVVTGNTSPEGQIQNLAAALAQNFHDLGDWALAALATQNPDSAMSWRHTGKSAPGRARADAAFLDGVFGGSDGSGRYLDLQQLGFNDYKNAHPEVILKGPGSGSSTGSTTQINGPDMATLREQATEAIRSLLFREPTAAEVDTMANRMRSAVIAAQTPAPSGGLGYNPFDPTSVPPDSNTVQGPDNVDPVSQYREQLLHSTEGQQLYAHNPGLAPEDYASQYSGVSQDVVGHQDLQAQRLGMQTGSFDTERGYLMGAGANSFTFRQKLWQVAQQVAQVL